MLRIRRHARAIARVIRKCRRLAESRFSTTATRDDAMRRPGAAAAAVAADRRRFARDGHDCYRSERTFSTAIGINVRALIHRECNAPAI